MEQLGKLSYTPVVQNPDEHWTQLQGRIDTTMIENFMPQPLSDPAQEDSLIMTCGPPKLKDSVQQLLDGLEYKTGFMFN